MAPFLGCRFPLKQKYLYPIRWLSYTPLTIYVNTDIALDLDFSATKDYHTLQTILFKLEGDT